MYRKSAWVRCAFVPLVAAVAMLLPDVAAAAPPVVKTVPWVATNPLIPHDTWSGKAIRLKGATDVQGSPWVFSWDPGDGTPPTPEATVANMYVLEKLHTYTGAPGTIFTATLTVRNTATGESATKNYFIQVRARELDIEVNVAIDEGLWYLHKTMNRSLTCNGLPCGAWNSGGFASHGTPSITPVNVNAFEVNGHLEGGSADNPYTETVLRGLRTVFTYLTAVQVGNNPASHVVAPNASADANGNGFGLHVPQHGHPLYEGGIFIDAIVASGTPTKLASTGISPQVNGRSYGDIVQDMVDYYAHCQVDSGVQAGGWQYSCNSGSDNSAAQWGAIGLIAAEDFGSTVPDWVKQTNRDHWIAYSQDSTGQFGYHVPSYFPWGSMGLTPSGMVQLAMDGVGRGNARWDKAESFMRDNFHENSAGPTAEVKDYYYGLFAFTKALLVHDSNGDGVPEPIELMQSTTPGILPLDWYNAERNPANPEGPNNTNGVARTLVNDQHADGYWYAHNNHGDQYPFETAWAIIMLNRTLFSGGAPVAVIQANPNPAVAFQNIQLNGGGSFHQDPSKTIVQWEWDLDNDGQFDDATGPIANVSFPAVGSYIVRLKVSDNGSPAASDDATLTIVVDTPPIAPTADAGGPYNFCAIPGVKFFLDGTGSSNPDEGQSEPGQPGNTIIAYAWDLDNDGQFDDATGAQPDVTAAFPGTGSFLVQLRVADNTAVSYPSSGQSNLSDTDSAQVNVRSSTDPACVCTTLTARPKPGEVQLNWTAVNGAASYNIYRGTTNGGPYVQIANSTSPYLLYLDKGLANGQTYYYVVRPAALNGNESCQSNQASATPSARAR